MIRGHGGNVAEMARKLGCSSSDITDMSNNINPLGPPAPLLEHLKDNIDIVDSHPEVDCNELIEAFARYHRIGPERVLAGNGTTQFIYTFPQALGTKKALIFGPTYADYGDVCEMYRLENTFMMAREQDLFKPSPDKVEDHLKGVDTVWICNPNNPTGQMIPKNNLVDLCTAHPDIRFIIDESYLAFSGQYDDMTMIGNRLQNVIVLDSFSKIFSVPGLRIGFLVASPDIVERFGAYFQPWCVNGLAQSAGIFLLSRFLKENDFYGETASFFHEERRILSDRLKKTNGLRPFSSLTSFVLIKIEARYDAPGLCAKMAEDRILLRNCSNFKGLSKQFVRISLKRPEINLRVADRLTELFS
jgi:threonine-phosphate decarboxylase